MDIVLGHLDIRRRHIYKSVNVQFMSQIISHSYFPLPHCFFFGVCISHTHFRMGIGVRLTMVQTPTLASLLDNQQVS